MLTLWGHYVTKITFAKYYHLCATIIADTLLINKAKQYSCKQICYTSWHYIVISAHIIVGEIVWSVKYSFIKLRCGS